MKSLPVRSSCWLFRGSIAERIYQYSEVKSVYLMSGGYDFTVMLEAKTMRAVAQFVSEKLICSIRPGHTACPIPLQITSPPIPISSAVRNASIEFTA